MARSCHVVAIPYPGRGHINPMMVLSHQLIACGIHVTFIVTEEWLGLINSAQPVSPPELNFMTIPNCIPSEHSRAKDHIGFIKAAYTKMSEPVEKLLDRLESVPQAIIADTYLPWAVEAANRRGIPVCSLFTMSAAFFSMLLHFDKFPPPENLQSPVRENDEFVEKYIPSLRSIKLSDIDPVYLSPLDLALQAVSTTKKAQCMLFTSFYELESRLIDSIRENLNYPVYTIGPSIPHMLPQKTESSDHLTWLNSQPKNSVLYISLGSFLSVSQSQFEEIAMGIVASKIKFFWVARENLILVREICGDDGLVVPWCDQLNVLTHPSIGGFLTHCGFNSTLETLFAGVPVLALPIIWDQVSNGRLLADEWNIGWNLRDRRGKDGILSREEIKVAVKKLMDLGNAETNEIRERALNWSRTANLAVKEGGSSFVSLRNFICDFINGVEFWKHW
ncbi:Glycosyltransferase [Rhynchospora pubera]|uniref:Glycosyltransferase n=1 Tax=Rhynchospora pubera TaxID=906938 RepID=A0AAV8C7Y6_9POAL|nr:Glycosyltransferase [Rhynchospora pubera]